MDGADDLTHTPLRVQINTFQSSLWPSPLRRRSKNTLRERRKKAEEEREINERGRHKLSAASFQLPKGPTASPTGGWKCLHGEMVRQHFVYSEEDKREEKSSLCCFLLSHRAAKLLLMTGSFIMINKDNDIYLEPIPQCNCRCKLTQAPVAVSVRNSCSLTSLIP